MLDLRYNKNAYAKFIVVATLNNILKISADAIHIGALSKLQLHPTS